MFKNFSSRLFTFAILILISACATKPAEFAEPPPSALAPGFDAELTGYQYPFPVQKFTLEAQKQSLQMSFMDLKSEKQDSEVIVLLHGKNFGGYAFGKVATRLQTMGYRVIIPDQIGFGKSSKPTNFQYSFQALASMTNQLLEAQGVKKYVLLGHSMGGMLATRMALMYPEKISKLILVNPIGLEDWKLMTTYKSIEETYRDELKSTSESIKKYQSDAYYAGTWKPEYDPLIEAASGWTKNPDFPLIAWNSALTSDMAFTQPVVYEFKNLKVRTALIIGQRDKTALGKAWATEENKKKMGLYPQLGRSANKLIPRSKLYELKGLGHLPFVENFDQFFAEGLVPALKL
ncbi:MAG: alpha/beta hydrolase [Bdellovibrionaceae bacterium]|nr:alpha/beta hydrolase [Pseudobdellovibrionaceae bacterium]